MKIAYDHQIFALQRHGGISRYIVELVRNLSTRPGVGPTVIAPAYINEYLTKPDVAGFVHGYHLPLEFRGGARVARVLSSAMLPFFWRRREFDVVHETYYSQACRGDARARVLTIHDLIHEQFPEDFPDTAQVVVAKRAAAERADHIICVSETTRRDAIRLLGIEPAKTSVIHLGYSLAFQGLRVSSDLAPCVLYVGQRSGYKNFAVLLEAFAASPKLRRNLELVAFGARGFSAGEERRIEQFGLTGRVRHVSGDDALLGAYYKAAIALVYPSRYEGFGLPPLEAMASGCPVVCSTAGSIREVVGDAAAYFEPDDSERLRTILERLTEDSAYTDELRDLGAVRIKRYSWATCAQETLNTYERLVGPARQAHAAS